MNANNNITIIGRLTADVEVKKTSGDVSTALFSVAVDRPKTKNQPEPGADFIHVKVWRGTADWLGKNIGKGTTLAVVGALRNDRWTGQDGQQHEMTYIDAEDVRVADNGAIKRPANYVAPADRAAQQPQTPQGYAQQAGNYAPPAQQPAYQQPAYQQPYQQPAQPVYQQPVQQPMGGYVPPAPAQQQPVYQQPAQPAYQQPAPQIPGPGGYVPDGFTPIADEDLPF